jgi:formylglycine-generating enzyme required for sulfatase activity
VRRRSIAFAAASVALVAAVVILARRGAEPPARCADGMILLGARCCGEGQRLDEGRCAGVPTRCAEGLRTLPAGCAPAPRVARFEGGVFRLGSGDWEAIGRIGAYEVRLAPFLLDAYEVTEERYAACVAASACPPAGGTGEPGRPVTGVTAEEAERFCVFAGGDLPTSEQLAFAMAGAKGRRYPWGDTGAVCRRAAWGLARGPCGDDASGPEVAGSHPDGASPEGVFDLAGNVAEWTLPPPDGAPITHVRGGSWQSREASALRSWQRAEVAVGVRSEAIGFRCAYPAPAATR